MSDDDLLLPEMTSPVARLRQCVGEILAVYIAEGRGNLPGHFYDLVMQELEQTLLETVLLYNRGNQSRTARMLGLKRTTLRSKLNYLNQKKEPV